jgi:hypothetical protein
MVIRDGLVHPTETIPLRNIGDGNRVMSNAIANVEQKNVLVLSLEWTSKMVECTGMLVWWIDKRSRRKLELQGKATWVKPQSRFARGSGPQHMVHPITSSLHH